MTKRKSKSTRTTVKAAAAKGSVRRSSTAPATASPPLIVLGFDDQQKPRGARFLDAKLDLVTKAADAMGFKVYEASSEDVAEYAKKLPLGRLYANGRGFVPKIRQSLYSDLVVVLGQEPQATLSKTGDKDSLPAARGLPRSWDEIGPGHLVIAHESLDYGWWEAIVLDRQGDTRNFADDLGVLVPRVYWEWTSSSMNVQEHIEGIRGDDAIDSAGLDRKALAARCVDTMLKMILVDGFFQADPHPGNVMWLPGNRIALIDFGMVGRLSPARRSQIVDLLAGFVHHDEEMMLEVLLDWRGNDAVNEARLAADLGELAFDYSDAQLKDLKIGTLLHRVSAILREHSIVLPADLALLFKALITLEGFGRRYDPEFRLIDRAEPFLNRAISERYQPADALRRGQAPLSDFLRLVASMPRDLAPLIKDARHGRMRGDLDLKLLDTFGDRVHSAMDRATIGIMTASLVIGSSIVMTVTGGPTVFGVSLLTYCGLVGYLVRVREQSLGYPFDLALRTAITEPSGARPEATGKGAW